MDKYVSSLVKGIFEDMEGRELTKWDGKREFRVFRGRDRILRYYHAFTGELFYESFTNGTAINKKYDMIDREEMVGFCFNVKHE